MILSRIAFNARTLSRFSAIGMTALVILLAGSVLAPAVEQIPPSGPIDPRQGISIADLSSQAFLATTMHLVDDPVFYAQAPGNSDSTAGIYGYESKSPKRAFLQSFLIPGWGQWYNGSRIKPFVFLGVEAAGLFGTTHFHSQGNKKQDLYQKFADADSGWDYHRYLAGLLAVYNITSDTMKFVDPAKPSDTLIFSHHIRADANGNPIKDQTYYENIGKYDQFSYGWGDFQDSVTFKTESRTSYLQQRASANKEFSRASTLLILTIGNHLLSAFEAAIGAAHHNKSMDQFGSVGAQLRFVQSPADGKLYPKFTLGYRF